MRQLGNARRIARTWAVEWRTSPSDVCFIKRILMLNFH